MKKSTFLLFIVLVITSNFLFAQVGIGTKTPNNSSMLDIESTDKGILIPRMTEAQKISVSSPVSGLLIYQIDNEAGFYFYDGSIWLRLVKNISPNFTGTITSGSISATGTISATYIVGDGSGLTGINFNTVSITTNINDIAANTVSITTNINDIAANTASITTNQRLIASNTASITTNQGAITTNTSSITTNINDIAANTSSITTNINDIATNTASISNNQGLIASNTSSITTNQVAIAANTASTTTNISDIAANTVSITTNQGLIASNTASITTNQGAIAANTASITTNINDIAANTASISNNQGLIASNTSSITTNQGAITTNTSSITTNINDIEANSLAIGTISGLTTFVKTDLVSAINSVDGGFDEVFGYLDLKANKANPTFTGTITSGAISATGTISATYFVGDGSLLTNLPFSSDLTGEVSLVGNSITLSNTAVIEKTLTGFTSGAGQISASDNILQAIQKADGNLATAIIEVNSGFIDVQASLNALNVNKASLASPIFTGTITSDSITSDSITSGTISSTGEIKAVFFVGDGSRLTDLPSVTDESITSDKILNGTILNADISSAAAIDQSKISGLTDALFNKVDKEAGGRLINQAEINQLLNLSQDNSGIISNTLNIGTLTNLTTTNQTDLVSAINEIEGTLNSKAPLASPNFTGTITSGSISATGTISATYIVGDGSRLTNLPSSGGLQSIIEEGNTGYRRADTNAANYGDIGEGAVDLSYSDLSVSSGATGDYSTAMGKYTAASGEISTAMGSRTVASGIGSTAMGDQTTASGQFSVAMGSITTASDFGSLVIGSFNDAGSSVSTNGSATSFTLSNTAFVIGNGTDYASKSDAFKVMFNGNTTAAGTITANAFVGNGSRLTGISFNTVSITTNINDIAANTASITTNQGLIASNTSSITTNQGVIAANTLSITSNISDIALKANKADPTFTGTITSGSISATGTISATYIVGDGSGLTNLPSSGGGLQSITESSKTGYRRSDADPINYGDIGLNAVDLSYSGTSGNFGATGNYSTAMGYKTIASGLNSTAMGDSNTASGNNSTAMGYKAKASGVSSTAMGDRNTASGSASTAMGQATTASGLGSTAMGGSTTAIGVASTAMGGFSSANGNYSTAMGWFTTASDYGSLVIGHYNSAGSSVSTNGSATAFDTDNTAFVIGNGTGFASKSDAFKVMFNGDVTTGGTVKATRFELTAATEINSSSNTTLDLSSGNVLTVSLVTSIEVLTITNAVVGTYLIKFVQDGTGQKTVDFSSTNWKWSGGTAPYVTNTANRTDIVTLIYDGENYYAAISQNF